MNTQDLAKNSYNMEIRLPMDVHWVEQSDKFHPKMCHYSLSKGICQNAGCKLRHIMGTKKISNETGTIEKNRKKKGTRDATVGRDPVNGGNSDAFLDMLNRIKAEMLDAVDARVAQCMPAQPQLPATGNCTRIAAPRMTMAGPASCMTQGMQGYHYPITMQSGQPWILPAPVWPTYPQTGLHFPVGNMSVPPKQGEQ